MACHFAKLAYHHYRLVDPFAVFGGRGDSGLALRGHGAASFRKNDMTGGHGIFCGMAERNVSAKRGMKDGGWSGVKSEGPVKGPSLFVKRNHPD